MVKPIAKSRGQRYNELIERLLNFEEKLSFSSFSKFCLSPKHFIEYKLDKKSSAAMRRGSLVDMLLLTPDEFETNYKICEGGWPTTPKQVEFCKSIIEGNSIEVAFEKNYKKGDPQSLYDSMKDYLDYKTGKTKLEPITRKQKLEADTMVSAVLRNDAARDILDQVGESQKPVTWEFCDFEWRGYIDWFGDPLVADLKNWADALPRKVGYTIRDRQTDKQLASYNLATGLKRQCFVIAVDPKYNISVTEIEQQSQANALKEMESKMNMFKFCILENLWHQSYDFWIDGGVYKY